MLTDLKLLNSSVYCNTVLLTFLINFLFSYSLFIYQRILKKVLQMPKILKNTIFSNIDYKSAY